MVRLYKCIPWMAEGSYPQMAAPNGEPKHGRYYVAKVANDYEEPRTEGTPRISTDGQKRILGWACKRFKVIHQLKQ